jgi:hypothetical protein
VPSPPYDRLIASGGGVGYNLYMLEAGRHFFIILMILKQKRFALLSPRFVKRFKTLQADFEQGLFDNVYSSND